MLDRDVDIRPRGARRRRRAPGPGVPRGFGGANSASNGFVGSLTGTARSRSAVHVRDMRLRLVVHPDQRGREARDLRRFGDDQRDRLAVEHDPVVVERPERRAVRRHVVLVGLVVVRHGRPVLVRQHGEHARDAACAAPVSMRVMRPLAMVEATTLPWSEAGGVELGGIFGGAGDLGEAVDAGCGGADVGCHGLCSRDLLVGLRLRRAARRLGQRADDGAARQVDLEACCARSPWRRAERYRRLARTLASVAGRPRSAASASRIAPGLVGDAAERKARLLDRAAVELEADRDGDQREGIGEPVADLEIGVIRREAARRQLDRRSRARPRRGWCRAAACRRAGGGNPRTR